MNRREGMWRYGALLCLALLVTNVHAGDVCELSWLGNERFALASNHSFDMFLADARNELIPVSAGFSFDDAPIHAIAKLVSSPNPNAKAVCSGVVVDGGRLVFTTQSCIRDKNAKYAFPYSNHDNPQPYPMLKIKKYWYKGRHGLAVGIVESPPTNLWSFSWRTSSNQFPYEWEGGNYWAMMGYLDDGTASPHIQTGCSAESYGTWGVTHDCGDDFLQGSPLFSNLCGDWQFVGLSTGANGKAVYFNTQYSSTIRSAYEELGRGYCIKDVKACSNLAMGKPAYKQNPFVVPPGTSWAGQVSNVLLEGGSRISRHDHLGDFILDIKK